LTFFFTFSLLAALDTIALVSVAVVLFQILMYVNWKVWMRVGLAVHWMHGLIDWGGYLGMENYSSILGIYGYVRFDCSGDMLHFPLWDTSMRFFRL